ncbi:MAG: LamG domain-containing protein, partial [Cyanobacteria bacterium J06638_6]
DAPNQKLTLETVEKNSNTPTDEAESPLSTDEFKTLTGTGEKYILQFGLALGRSNYEEVELNNPSTGAGKTAANLQNRTTTSRSSAEWTDNVDFSLGVNLNSTFAPNQDGDLQYEETKLVFTLGFEQFYQFEITIPGSPKAEEGAVLGGDLKLSDLNFQVSTELGVATEADANGEVTTPLLPIYLEGNVNNPKDIEVVNGTIVAFNEGNQQGIEVSEAVFQVLQRVSTIVEATSEDSINVGVGTGTFASALLLEESVIGTLYAIQFVEQVANFFAGINQGDYGPVDDFTIKTLYEPFAKGDVEALFNAFGAMFEGDLGIGIDFGTVGDGAFLNLSASEKLAASAELLLFNWSWSHQWTEEVTLGTGPSIPNLLNELTDGNTNNGDVTVIYGPTPGTNALYQKDGAVRSDLLGPNAETLNDLTSDSDVAMAFDPLSGEVLLSWVSAGSVSNKSLAEQTDITVSRVYAADLTSSARGWSTDNLIPVNRNQAKDLIQGYNASPSAEFFYTNTSTDEIVDPSTIDINSGLYTLNRMLVWTFSETASDLTANSTPEEVQEAVKATDIYYSLSSRPAAGGDFSDWSTPVLVVEQVGTDRLPTLGQDPDGTLRLAWVQDESQPGSLVLETDGDQSFAQIPSIEANNFSNNQDFTVEAWISVQEGVQNNAGILEKWNGTSSGYPFAIRYQDGKIIALRYDGQSSDNNPVVTSTTTFNPGDFHHVAFVKNGDTLNLYVDGQLEDSTPDTTADSSTSTSNTAPLYLGRRGQSSEFFFTGQIDDVRLWNVARTQAEIQADLSGALENPGAEANLVGYYTFEDGTVKDLSQEGNNGTLDGAIIVPPASTIYTRTWDGSSWNDQQVVAQQSDLRISKLLLDDFGGNAAVYWTDDIEPSYSAVVQQDGPTWYYRLNDAGSPTAENLGSGGSSYNATFNAGTDNTGSAVAIVSDSALQNPSTGDGDPDASAQFTGDGGNLAIPVGQNDLGASFSLELWVKLDSLEAGQVLLEKVLSPTDNNPNPTPDWSLKTGSNGTLVFEVVQDDATATAIDIATQANTLQIDTWYYVVATVDSTVNGTPDNPLIDLYLNGQSVVSQPKQVSALQSTPSLITAGASLKGQLDEIAIYNRLLGTAPPVNTDANGNVTDYNPGPTGAGAITSHYEARFNPPENVIGDGTFYAIYNKEADTWTNTTRFEPQQKLLESEPLLQRAPTYDVVSTTALEPDTRPDLYTQISLTQPFATIKTITVTSPKDGNGNTTTWSTDTPTKNPLASFINSPS